MGQGNPATSSASSNDYISPAKENATSTNPGTRYGKGGTAPGQGDASNETIITKSSPGV